MIKIIGFLICQILVNQKHQLWCYFENYLNPQENHNVWLSPQEIHQRLSYSHISIKLHHYLLPFYAHQMIQNHHLQHAYVIRGDQIYGTY